jgi:TatA/E family protein of Tat protein translocase
MIGLTNPVHIALLLSIALLLFGAKRLPEIGRGLGKRHARVQGIDHGRRRHVTAAPSVGGYS